MTTPTSLGTTPLFVQVFTSSEPAAWSNSYLISGEHDAILFDVVQLRSEATKLADAVEASGKNLTTIFISHAHLYLQEKHLESWLIQLDEFEKFAQENVVTLYPGHGTSEGLSLIGTSRAYLLDFAASVQGGNADQVNETMLAKYPNYHNTQFLTLFSIPAYFPAPKTEKQ